MRLLALSDSHGDVRSLLAALRLHTEADAVAFLGDGEADFMSEQVQLLLGDRIRLAVRGNCDLWPLLPDEDIAVLGGKTIYALHGHTKFVKYGTERLIEAAKKRRADVVLYGHTHKAKAFYEEGLYLLCPGSIRNGDYGLVDITEGGVFCGTANLWERG